MEEGTKTEQEEDDGKNRWRKKGKGREAKKGTKRVRAVGETLNDSE